MPTTKDYVNHGGLSRQAIFRAVEASLERLDTPYIDVLQIHRFDKTVPIEETMEALHDLVRSGKVRYIGASSMWAFQVRRPPSSMIILLLTMLVRDAAALRRAPRLDQVRLNAEPLQPPLPRRGA